jgi:hypothetical protein
VHVTAIGSVAPKGARPTDAAILSFEVSYGEPAGVSPVPAPETDGAPERSVAGSAASPSEMRGLVARLMPHQVAEVLHRLVPRHRKVRRAGRRERRARRRSRHAGGRVIDKVVDRACGEVVPVATWAIAESLSEHAGRVTVSSPMKTRAIASAKVKTDEVDARVLAQLGAAEFVPEVVDLRQLRRAVTRDGPSQPRWRVDAAPGPSRPTPCPSSGLLSRCRARTASGPHFCFRVNCRTNHGRLGGSTTSGRSTRLRPPPPTTGPPDRLIQAQRERL